MLFMQILMRNIIYINTIKKHIYKDVFFVIVALILK